MSLLPKLFRFHALLISFIAILFPLFSCKSKDRLYGTPPGEPNGPVKKYVATISSIGGSGIISFSGDPDLWRGSGLSPGYTYRFDTLPNTVITITKNSGTVQSWEGTNCTGNGPCSFTMDGDKTVTVKFN